MSDTANRAFSYAFIDAVIYQGKGDIENCQKSLLLASIAAKTDKEQNKIADFVKKYGIPY